MKLDMRRALALVAILGVLVTACGGGGRAEPEESPEQTTAAEDPASGEETSPAESEQAGNVEEFCDTAVEAIAVVGTGPEVDFETAAPEEIEEAMAAYAEQANPLLDDLTAAAPDEISADIETIVGLVRQSLEGGEPPFEEPEFVEADTALDEYMLSECGYSALDVQGQDYAYEGVPESLEAGTYGVTFTNAGAEVHEMIMFRLAEDAGSLEEVMALPEDQIEGQVTFVTGAFAPPGEADVTFIALEEPGRYGLVCFLPQGTTSLEQLEEEPPPGESPAPDASPPGPPHFTLGMAQELTVE